MSRRDDFKKTLGHIQPEHIIVDFGGNPLSCMEGKSMANLLDLLGFAPKPEGETLHFGQAGRIDERILNYFGTDTRAVGYIFSPKNTKARKISDTEEIDVWGIRRRFTGMYWDIVEFPLKDATLEDLESFDWPDADAIDQREIDECARQAKDLFENTDYVICAEHPVYGVFELGCWMCGFDDFFYRMAAEPEFVEAFFDKIWKYQKRITERYYAAVGPYVHYTSSGDDFAMQTGLFFAPEMFRNQIAPYLKERIALTKSLTSAAFLHHSCGAVHDLIPELLACGVEILNPIQPRATGMEPERLKADYGKLITFHGGFDTQKILPLGSVTEIDEEVHRLLTVLGKDGGYIFAAAHNIQQDVPPENVAAMLAAARKYR